MLHEKRKFKRSDIFHVIEINSYSPLLGLIKNFSYQGLTIELDSIDFEQKENIEFTLKYPQNDLRVTFLGDIVWESSIANTFLAGIKLRKMDRESKDKLIEILCSIREISIDSFDYDRNAEFFSIDRNDEKAEMNESIKLMSEISKNNKKILISNVIIGLSISFLILFGFFIFKGLRIPFINVSHQPVLNKESEPKKYVSKPEYILRQLVKEQEGNRVLNEDAALKKDRETQNIDSKNIVQAGSDYNIQDRNILKKRLMADDQHASQLIYTIQLESLSKISDAQKKFDYIIQTLNEKNLNMLRIEKVEKYYTVRLGQFDNYEIARKFLQEIKPHISEAIILKAHIKNDRIIRS